MTEHRTVGDVIAAQVKTYRQRRGWSIRQLAEECAKLGATQLTADSLTNIERRGSDAKRGRRMVTLEEWLILAHVLGVPPLLLLLDLESGEPVEIAPEVVIHPWLAWQWITAETPPVMTNRAVTRVREFGEAKQTVYRYRWEQQAANAVSAARFKLLTAEEDGDQAAVRSAREEYTAALANLAKVLDDMVEHGMTPPGKPREWIEKIRALGLSKYPDSLVIFEPDDGEDGQR